MRRRSVPSLRLPRRPWQAFLLVVLLLALAALQQWHPELFQRTAPRPLTAGTYHVARVVDGDTLVLADTAEHVRLIGADTPETVKPNWPVEPWGPEATAFTKEFLSATGGDARLEFDGEARDKYGRILAYVWTGDRMLNEELIRAGLARAELQYHYSATVKARFRRAEAEARAARRGIWSKEKGTAHERR
jgi:micrococcal nuclease